MSSRYFATLTALIISIMLFLPTKAFSQIIRATGSATEASSQLVFYYDEVDEGDMGIQVTNSNDTQGVWVHVQIFRSFNDGTTSEPINTFCDERDFVDFYTPNDTHIYTLDEDEFDKNLGSAEGTPGESTSIVDTDDTKGFVVVTPIVSESDFTAISFQWMVGNFLDESEYVVNAMGRDAVDFTTGQVVADGTPLDGTSNGFVLLQPGELTFDFAGDNDDVDIINFAWADVYGDPGLLGYEVRPSTVNLQPFLFDYKEDITSCGVRNVECFFTVGLNETIGQHSDEFGPEDLLCAGAETPTYPDTTNFTSDWEEFGWVRMFVSGLESNGNILGLVYFDEEEGAYWMNTNN